MRIVHFSRHIDPSPLSGGLHAAALRVLITGIAVFLAISIVPGIEVTSFGAGLAAVLVLTILNLLLRPILFLLTLPLIVLSLGLFLLVLNALLLELTAYLVKGFTVSGFWPAVGGALVISVISTFLNVLAPGQRHVIIRHDDPPGPRIINPPD
jgi:putative membrane protein